MRVVYACAWYSMGNVVLGIFFLSDLLIVGRAGTVIQRMRRMNHLQRLVRPHHPRLVLHPLQRLSNLSFLPECRPRDLARRHVLGRQPFRLEQPRARVGLARHLQMPRHCVLARKPVLADDARVRLQGQVTVHVPVAVVDPREGLCTERADKGSVGLVRT